MAIDRPVIGRELIQALLEVGIADKNTRRVIIDVPVDDVVRIYIEKFGTRSLYNIIPAIRDSDGKYKIVKEEMGNDNQ